MLEKEAEIPLINSVNFIFRPSYVKTSKVAFFMQENCQVTGHGAVFVTFWLHAVLWHNCPEFRAVALQSQGIYDYLHSAHFLRFLGIEEQVLWSNLSEQSIWPSV